MQSPTLLSLVQSAMSMREGLPNIGRADKSEIFNRIAFYLEHGARQLDLRSFDPDDILTTNNPTVLFTSSGVCRFYPNISKGNPAAGFVSQWCFRDRNYFLIKHGITPEWSSTFRQFCAITDASRYSDMVRVFAGLFGTISQEFGRKLLIETSDQDGDIYAAAAESVAANDVLVCANAPRFRHSYGTPNITGRNMNLLLVSSGFERTIGNIIVLENRGVPFAAEAAFGLETSTSAALGAASSLECALLHDSDAIQYVSQNLGYLDALQVTAHLIVSGIRPFSSNRGRLLRKYIDLFLAEAKLPLDTLRECMEYAIGVVALTRKVDVTPHTVGVIADYIVERATLSQDLTADRLNATMARSWSQTWPTIGGGER